MALLEIEGMARSFTIPTGERLDILTDINLQVEAGDHIAIVGRSGTGKSTLLNLLGLLDKPTAGVYRFDGQDTSNWGDGKRARTRGKHFGFVFQSFNLLPGLGVVENVAAPLLYANDASYFTRESRARDLLVHMGLGERLDSRLDQLSGGEQQRVALARALVRRPRVLLADEPTGALDVETGQHVMETLEREARECGAALIVITHDPAIAARARRAFRLGDGVLTPLEISDGHSEARAAVAASLSQVPMASVGARPASAAPEVTAATNAAANAAAAASGPTDARATADAADTVGAVAPVATAAATADPAATVATTDPVATAASPVASPYAADRRAAARTEEEAR
ncbi:ABC transporter ATP-binding protein [Buchananella felis]|uniref:ABC transporter ATP-binding protein n=1 Tax=Buchananella felis TaxID=3231492 RepID=UPI0035281AF7